MMVKSSAWNIISSYDMLLFTSKFGITLVLFLSKSVDKPFGYYHL